MKITELLNDLEPLHVPETAGEVSCERVKEITMKKIKSETKQHVRRPMGLILAATLCVVLVVGAYAGGILTGKDLAKHDLSLFAGKDAGEAMREEYLDNGIQNSVTQFFFGRHKSVSYYENGDIMGLDNRTLNDKEYRPVMTDAEAAAYADKAESIALDVLDSLHENGYIKGDSNGVESCFCNDFAGSQTIFNGNAVWVNVLMKDGSAYALFLSTEDFSSQGFLYFDAETAPKMYDGVYTAMHNGTLEQYWYDLQHGSGLG